MTFEMLSPVDYLLKDFVFKLEVTGALFKMNTNNIMLFVAVSRLLKDSNK